VNIGASGLLLDTCALIWLAARSPLKKDVLLDIREAVRCNSLYVSAVSAWEIGLLERRHRLRSAIQLFAPEPKAWFAEMMAAPGSMLAPLTSDIAIDVSLLPGSLHNDPADRMLISTARHLDVPIVTSDRKIIAYTDQGLVKVLPC